MEYNEVTAVAETAFDNGLEKGKNQKAVEIAKGMLIKGLDTSMIIELTGLTFDEIEGLR